MNELPPRKPMIFECASHRETRRLLLCGGSLVLACDVAGAGAGVAGASRIVRAVPDDEPSQCPAGMVLVPARTGKEPVPAHRRKPPLGAFCLARTETTVANWADCVHAGACTWPSYEAPNFIKPWRRMGRASWLMGNPAMPINYIDHATATSFCKWAGGRLPSREEWDWAHASAQADYNVPWGEYLMLPPGDDTPNALPHGPLCRSVQHVILRSMPCPTGSNAGDVTLQGIFDMDANVQEWTSTPFADTMFEVGGDDFTHKSGHFVPNGGSHPPHTETSTIGVRCAADPRK
jgi:formylglycine-generating enzyme required for sulfatase activity